MLTPFVADTSLDEKDAEEGGLTGDRAIHDRDMRLLREANSVVAEVTIPSHSVGYEIGRAVDMMLKFLFSISDLLIIVMFPDIIVNCCHYFAQMNSMSKCSQNRPRRNILIAVNIILSRSRWATL